jgi:hypothetical protein
MENIFFIFFAIGVSLIVGLFILAIVSVVISFISNASSPRLAREARVIGKRLHVSGGTNGSSTSYYATFEFPDGSREEFRVSSQIYGMIAEGDMGTLQSQGTYVSNFNRRV